MLDSAHIVTSTASSGSSVYSSIPAVPSTLLPLPSVFTYPSTSSLSPAPPTSVSAERPLRTLNNAPSRQANSHQLPAASIILLAAGSVLLVATILILVKLFVRPRRRSHPTPSLPILQDVFPSRKLGDESPLFGGKERLSSQPIMNAIPWTWTQYQSDVPKSAPVTSIAKSAATNQSQTRHSRLVDEPPNVIDTAEPTILMREAPVTPITANQSSNGHPNKAMSRLSTLSGLVDTGSVYESTGQENIGIAVSSGQGDLESGFAARDYRKRASARQSMRNFDKRLSTIYGSPEGLAYTMSPAVPLGNDERLDFDGSTRQGRARVKAPYVAGSYLRGSAPKAHLEVNPFGDPVNGVYVLPPMPGSSTGKEADSTGGVGPITPDPAVSPGFSLYPDDSLGGVTEDRIWTIQNHIKGKQSTHDDEGGVAGDDLSGAVSPAAAARRLSMQITKARDFPSEKSKRTDDRPPRVPSPPVLPSLAQMAMAHTHGQEYGDYRSPTYSLYGLYSGS